MPDSSGKGVFIAKLNASGVWQWCRTVNSPDAETATGVGVDAAENIYVSGQFGGFSLAFGSYTLINHGVLPSPSPPGDIFIAKLDSAGNWQWAKGAGGPAVDWGSTMALDRAGNVYLTGYFEGPATFGNQVLYHQGGDDLFVAKLDAAGNWQWATTGSGPYHETGTALALDSRGGVYVAGTADMDSLSDVVFGGGATRVDRYGGTECFRGETR